LTQWYRRYEINFRIALFFSAATAAGAFGGLLARLINFMDGIAGFHGWVSTKMSNTPGPQTDAQRWIFILEGILTVIVAVISFFVMYDYPDTAKFLNDEERRAVQLRLKLDNDGCSSAFKAKFIKDAFLDWKVWVVSRPLSATTGLNLTCIGGDYVPRLAHARLLLLPLLAHPHRQPRLRRRNGATHVGPAIYPCGHHDRSRRIRV
jgi:MFS family permease